MNKSIFVTGAAGFIGFHISKKLISNQIQVIGFDNLNSYYDLNLKRSRLKEIEKLNNYSKGWQFLKGDLIEKEVLLNHFEKYRPNIVIHLAAQAGVRHSLENPDAYIQSNIVGFNNILECCKKYPVEHFLYASSSSVYGGNHKIPFSEKDAVDHPVSLYAATKRSNELIAHSYSHLFRIPSTSMRFFTVYGPWGRPDMAPMIFTNSIIKKEPIMIFNEGNMSRDFTYIDDVTEVIYRLIKKPPLTSTTFDKNNPDKSISSAPHRILNIGNGSPIDLMEFINIIEKELQIDAIKSFKPMQPGDVVKTFADTTQLQKLIKYKPKTKLVNGLKKFINWYKEYYLID